MTEWISLEQWHLFELVKYKTINYWLNSDKNSFKIIAVAPQTI
jgi:hypothetical protein